MRFWKTLASNDLLGEGCGMITLAKVITIYSPDKPCQTNTFALSHFSPHANCLVPLRSCRSMILTLLGLKSINTGTSAMHSSTAMIKKPVQCLCPSRPCKSFKRSKHYATGVETPSLVRVVISAYATIPWKFMEQRRKPT
jgi:hypothetical protein